MVKETMMARRCSHCGNNGHNARTCTDGVNKCVKLFGVNILEHSRPQRTLNKSLSFGNLNLPSRSDDGNGVDYDLGYHSDGKICSEQSRAARDRRKGKPWTEEEHLTFLAGLETLGRGDWRGISKKYVISRTPTQVASHAQKYFLRQASNDKKKSRSSVFDVPLKESMEQEKNPEENSTVMPWMETVQEPASLQTNLPGEITNRFQQLPSSCYHVLSPMFPPVQMTSTQIVHPSGIPKLMYTPIGIKSATSG